MSAALVDIELPPTTEMQRYLIVRKYAGRDDVVVSAYPHNRNYGRMIAFGMGKPHFHRGCDGLSLWVEHTGFDVTEAEATQLASALGLEIQS